MRKSIFITLLAITICASCQSKEKNEKATEIKENSVEQLFNNFSKEKNVEKVNIGGAMMLFANSFADTKGVSGIEVYSLDDCEQNVKDRFDAAVKSIKDSEYEELVSTSSDGERTKIMVKISDDLIRELIVINSGNDPALIRIKGKIKPEDVQDVIDSSK